MLAAGGLALAGCFPGAGEGEAMPTAGTSTGGTPEGAITPRGSTGGCPALVRDAGAGGACDDLSVVCEGDLWCQPIVGDVGTCQPPLPDGGGAPRVASGCQGE
jgi:hypothetical protein